VETQVADQLRQVTLLIWGVDMACAIGYAVMLFAPAVVSVVGMLLSTTAKARHVWSAAFCVWLLVFTVLTGMSSWRFKDGFGPGAVRSSGITAIKRFAVEFWAPLLVGVIASVVAWESNRVARHRQMKGTG
jgi:hypothetical protein